MEPLPISYLKDNNEAFFLFQTVGTSDLAKDNCLSQNIPRALEANWPFAIFSVWWTKLRRFTSGLVLFIKVNIKM